MAEAVPNLCVSRKVLVKPLVNWNAVCGAMQDLPWHNISSADKPVKVVNEHLSLLVGRYGLMMPLTMRLFCFVLMMPHAPSLFCVNYATCA